MKKNTWVYLRNRVGRLLELFHLFGGLSLSRRDVVLWCSKEQEQSKVAGIKTSTRVKKKNGCQRSYRVDKPPRLWRGGRGAVLSPSRLEFSSSSSMTGCQRCSSETCCRRWEAPVNNLRESFKSFKLCVFNWAIYTWPHFLFHLQIYENKSSLRDKRAEFVLS